MVPVVSSLQRLASFPISSKGGNVVMLQVAQGSVVDFAAPKAGGGRIGAIVNAANEMCLGGGGVDGAISLAGGPNLAQDRQALPTITATGVRCPTGSAVTTGPGKYGSLRTPYVIHAVGPNYRNYNGFEEPDSLLRSAYQASLDQCKQHGITDVGFALLSAGIFRGNRQSKDVLKIGIHSIRDWVIIEQQQDEGISIDSFALESVTLCGYSSKETDLLLDICKLDL